MPVRIRNGARLGVQPVEHVELLQQSLAGEAVRDRQAGRVVGQHHVLVSELDRGAGHLLDRRSAVGPVRVAVAVAAQRGAERRALGRQRDRRLVFELQQVGRRLAVHGLGDDARRDRADVVELGERARLRPRLDLRRIEIGDRVARVRERLDAVRGFERAVEQEDDAVEGVDRLHG